MTDQEAYDAINLLVETAWLAGVPTIAADSGTGKADDPNELRFKGKEKSALPVGFWGRVAQDIVEQPIRSMSDELTFDFAKKRYETYGICFVQVFAQKTLWNADRRGRAISYLLRDAFRVGGQAGLSGIWYQNARVQSLPDDGSNYRWNVVSEFRYDTIG